MQESGFGVRYHANTENPEALTLKLETLFREETEEPSRDPETTLAARADEGGTPNTNATSCDPTQPQNPAPRSQVESSTYGSVERNWKYMKQPSAISHQPSGKATSRPCLYRDGDGIQELTLLKDRGLGLTAGFEVDFPDG